MALGIDAQVLAELGPLLQAIGETPPLAIGDIEGRRINGHRMFDYVASTWKPVAGVEVDRYTVTRMAGLPTELHLLPWCPHAFELLARGADASQRAINDRLRRLRSL